MTIYVGAARCLSDAIELECSQAEAIHGGFHSHHEGWAILKEEVEEVIDSADDFKHCARGLLESLWNGVKCDEIGMNETVKDMQKIAELAFDLAAECVQVGAMCKKWYNKIEYDHDAQWEKVGETSETSQ